MNLRVILRYSKSPKAKVRYLSIPRIRGLEENVKDPASVPLSL